MQVNRVLETCLYVDDLGAAEAFYREVLGLQVLSRAAGRHVFFRCGEAVLLLFNPMATRAAGDVPAHGAQGPGHVAFAISEADLAAWRVHLDHHGVTVESTVVWPNGGRSFYFRDPAGNSLEMATPRTWDLAEG
jgi:catechol 2,3-dioxygenase-like lactoylglutathione lyase family enzyme